MFRTLLSACLLACFALPAFAAAPPGRPLESKAMTALIENLGHQDFRVRELADRTLRAQGEPALPALKKALSHRELEVRRRALRIIPAIETAKLFAPKRVTLKVNNQPLPKVLEALSKSSGYKVMDGGGIIPFPFRNQRLAPKDDTKGKERLYTYDIFEEPFWAVVDRICRDGGLSLSQSYGDDTVRLTASSGHAPFTGRDGPFLAVAQKLQLVRNIDLGSSNKFDRTETLTLDFTLYAEPRLPFMNMGEPRVESAYDELNNSMVVDKSQSVNPQEVALERLGMRGRYYGGNYKQLMMTASVPLSRASTKASKVKLLRGVVPMTVLVEQRPIALSEKVLSAKGTKKEVGDLTFEIKEVVNDVKNNQVSLSFTITNKQGSDYSWQNNLYNRIELYDDKGNKLTNWGSSWGGSGPNNVQMTLRFGTGNVQKPGVPTKFVFQHWEMRQHNIEFVFRDLPLP